jgi:hypothetical protein
MPSRAPMRRMLPGFLMSLVSGRYADTPLVWRLQERPWR